MSLGVISPNPYETSPGTPIIRAIETLRIAEAHLTAFRLGKNIEYLAQFRFFNTDSSIFHLNKEAFIRVMVDSHRDTPLLPAPKTIRIDCFVGSSRPKGYFQPGFCLRCTRPDSLLNIPGAVTILRQDKPAYALREGARKLAKPILAQSDHLTITKSHDRRGGAPGPDHA